MVQGKVESREYQSVNTPGTPWVHRKMETNSPFKKVVTYPAGRGALLLLLLVACGSLRAAEKTPASVPLSGRVERFTKVETLPVDEFFVDLCRREDARLWPGRDPPGHVAPAPR